MAKQQMCQSCRQIPAGISKKTGKPYEAFWVCESPDCPNFRAKTGFQKVQMPTQSNALQEWLEERFDDLRQRLIDLQRTIDSK